jgi:coenzyme PQQ biosynthesis protein C
MTILLSEAALEARLRDIGARRYHRAHPFHHLLHGGKCTKGQVQAWALNRYYYQAKIPQKDANLIARCDDCVGVTAERLAELRDAGLDHVQISIQDSEQISADHIAGFEGAFVRKCELAHEVVRLKMPLTVNAVVHRANIEHIGDMVELALRLGASRVEIAHVQYLRLGP